MMNVKTLEHRNVIVLGLYSYIAVFAVVYMTVNGVDFIDQLIVLGTLAFSLFLMLISIILWDVVEMIENPNANIFEILIEYYINTIDIREDIKQSGS
jgi:hypothetical protein